MNQKGFAWPIIVVVVAIVVIAGGWYVSSRSQVEPQSSDDVEQTQDADSTSMESITGTLSDLFALGRSVKCTYSGEGNTGTFYIDGARERMRGDFTTQVDGGPMNGHIINNSEYVYTWTDGQAQGAQIPVPEGNPALSETEPENIPAAYRELNKNYTYNCGPWGVSESMFALPSDVEFINVAEQLQQLQSQGIPAADCSVCDQAEGAAKQQCLQALGCL